MATVTVKLDKKRADLLNRRARLRKISTSEILRKMIDRVGANIADHPIDHTGSIVTADDLIEACNAAAGRGLERAQR